MNSKFCYALILGSALVFTGCGKKMNQFRADYFSVNPNPLEVVGEKVPATVTGKIPGKFFVKNAEVTVTPYLEFNGTEIASTPYTFQGEKVRGNNPVISYDGGGTVTIPVSYNYNPEMIKSNLSLAFTVRQGGKQYALPRVKVADGVVATAALADAATVSPAIAPDKFQRIINEKFDADIKFLINQANIRDGQLRTAEMNNLHQEIAEANEDNRREIKEINITSYASPDGGVELNTRLAENREKNTKSYVQNKLKKDNISEFGELTANFTPQDWEGFQRLVAASNIQDKELILSVLSMYKDPEQREREIRNLSSVFDQLAEEILPQLRYSRITASIDVIGKSDEEIMNIYSLNPKALSVDEILYAATLTDNNDKRLQIYDTAIELYPKDYRAYNNLGMCQYIDQDYEAAEANFAQAARLAPESGEAQMNLGLVSLLNKNYKEATAKFGNAAGVPALGDALGVYYMKQGDYNSAIRAFGDSKTNNAALAQILNKDYSKAKNTLSGVVYPNATTFYITAILGARTNNEKMVMNNLRQAIKLDNTLAAKAQNDLEFAKFNLRNL
ncbi:tetratricopeptide repeat protein [Muribaculum sp. NM65_B17]|jgi:tetratricopeptide (TPR) repeat protein|uniref:tetratricopeptide repeat protein n=3 Tax=Muribaculum TaxID=1918540 RepID=UPI0010935809|nr:tetratricopeptide repeat protein [Muribaculum sp. NM65_B17]TGY05531.1 tetratricopeptide repeat protein [Muribaculum sp. NM65_B17]THG42870.1 tetratricopeptide repeat protein [Muribaculaceae bacterium]